MNNIFAPDFLPTVSTSDLVSFNLQARDTNSIAGVVSFGQAFAPGALSINQGLVATLDGSATRVQIDPKSYYSDGSIEFAVLTLEHPTVAANTTVKGVLSTSALIVQPTVDLQHSLNRHSINVSLQFQGGANFEIDIGQKLSAALANGTAETWLQGAFATQSRVTIPIAGSMRLLATVTAYADGTLSATIGFDNDVAMGASGGTVQYATQLVVDGITKMSQASISQAQYQDWSATVYSGLDQGSALNVQHDPRYLSSFGAIPNFNFAGGVDPSVLSSLASDIASPGWGDPLSPNGVTKLMPTTGGRPDIGITTLGNAAWLMTQDPAAATFALGEAQASGAAPWNYWNASTNTWVNSDLNPRIWTDPRGGTSTNTVGLTQQTTATDWQLDTSHQPDLSYYSYLMTGDEQYLDRLNAQASFDITNTWPDYRGLNQIVVGSDQVRASAWNMREIDEAAWANPAGSAERSYFQRISDANWGWLVQQLPNWTALQGQAYGQIEGYAWGTSQNRPWMQDYFASVAAEAARHGNADARTVLNWESNFLVGRFLNASNGFDPHDGIAYNLVMGNADGTRNTTWSAIENATISYGSSNLGGFSQSIGDYGALALQSLSDIISVTGSSDAIKAYNWLITSNAPYTSPADMAGVLGLQFDILPVLPTGYSFASDGEIIGAAAPASPSLPPETVSSTPPPSSLPTSPTPSSTPVEPSVSQVATPSSPEPVGIYRFFDTATGGHIFTSDPSEFSSNSAFVQEHNDFGSLADTAMNTDEAAAKVYRLFDMSTGGHFYTTSKTELSGLTSPSSSSYRSDFVFEPASAFVEHTSAQTGDVAVYRFFDMTTGGHFFTSSQSEYAAITDSTAATYRADLHLEGVAFYAPSA